MSPSPRTPSSLQTKSLLPTRALFALLFPVTIRILLKYNLLIPLEDIRILEKRGDLVELNAWPR